MRMYRPIILLDRLEAGYKSAVAAIHAGGITTIADLEFPMLQEDVDFTFSDKILKSEDTKFYTYCVPSSRYEIEQHSSIPKTSP